MYSSASNRPNRSGSSGFSSSTTTATFSSAAASFGGRESSARRTCSSKDTSVRGPQRTPLRDEIDGQHAECEPADVSEERDSAALLGVEQAQAALPDLEADPDTEEPDRRDFTQEDQAEEDDGEDAS